MNDHFAGGRPDAAVGARVRIRRKLLGMSQTTLAEKIGVTFQQVQKYEKGTHRIGSSRLAQIAVVLTPVRHLLGWHRVLAAQAMSIVGHFDEDCCDQLLWVWFYGRNVFV